MVSGKPVQVGWRTIRDTTVQTKRWDTVHTLGITGGCIGVNSSMILGMALENSLMLMGNCLTLENGLMGTKLKGKLEGQGAKSENTIRKISIVTRRRLI